jgi:alpha-L-glutamate ligase-like protein
MGVLGMNRRNTECILDLNPRARFPLVDGKKQMRDLCVKMGVPTPDLYALVAAHSALRHLPRLLAGRDDFVIKPNRGAGGRGVLVIVRRDGADFVRHNGQRLGTIEVTQHVSSIISGLFSLGGRADEALLQQRVVPDAAFERISFQGTADVRVIVYRGVPAMAMLRLPTRESGGRANLHQGAIGAGVELESGRTTRAVLRNRTTERHPDTGASVVGFAVPYWPQILEMSQRVSDATGLGYVGVDVVVDRRRGPLLLEANARPGLAIQIANGAGLVSRLEEIDRELEA